MVYKPSQLRTNTGIVVGDSIDNIINAYKHAAGSPQTAQNGHSYQSIWINGKNQFKIGFETFFYPTLTFTLKDSHVIGIELSNAGYKP